MKIKRMIGNILEANAYILTDETTLETIIIDPAGAKQQITDYIRENHLNVKGILWTHSHHDHIGGSLDLKKAFGVEIYVHKNEYPLITQKYKNEVHLIDSGESFKIGDQKLNIINTKGHTAGSISIEAENQKTIFTGDTVFDVEIGRIDLETGSLSDMEKTIKNIVSKWEDDITIYPGHGDEASMDFVKKQNREYQEMLFK